MARIKKLYRSRNDKILFGLCGGLGKYFNIDPFLIRLIFILTTFAGGVGATLYIILSIITPEAPRGEKGSREDNFKKFVNNIGQKTQEFVTVVKKDKQSLDYSRNIIGVFIIILGFGLLIQQFLPFNIFVWQLFWPSLIILIGILIIFSKKN